MKNKRPESIRAVTVHVERLEQKPIIVHVTVEHVKQEQILIKCYPGKENTDASSKNKSTQAKGRPAKS
jgi:hypothetical protein